MRNTCRHFCYNVPVSVPIMKLTKAAAFRRQKKINLREFRNLLGMMIGPLVPWLFLLFSILTVAVAVKVAAYHCGKPAIPTHARILIIGESVSDAPRDQRYHRGTIAEVICDEGYELIGNSTIICSGQGSWESDQPSCGTNVALGKSPYQSSTVPGGDAANALGSHLLTEGDHLSCSQTGDDDSPWWKVDLGASYRNLAVEVTSPLSYNFQLRYLEFRVGNSMTHAENGRCTRFQGPLDYGETRVFRCSGLAGRYVSIQIVGVKGSLSLCGVKVFSFEVRREAQLGCGSPDSKENSTIKGSNFAEGGTIDYECPTGHATIGPRKRTCTHNGVWTGTAPTCQYIDCGLPDKPDNGSVVLDDQRTTFYATAQHSCNEGHSMIGSPVRTCTINGTWDPSKPKCLVIDCQTPPDVRNGNVFLVNGTTTVDSIAECRCAPGFTLQGPFAIQCTASGEWSGPVPVCVSETSANPNLALILGIAAVVAVICFCVWLYRKKIKELCSNKAASDLQIFRSTTPEGNTQLRNRDASA